MTAKAGLQAYRDNIEKLRNRAAGLISEGKSQDEVGKVMIAEFGRDPKGMQIDWSLPGMIAGLK